MLTHCTMLNAYNNEQKVFALLFSSFVSEMLTHYIMLNGYSNEEKVKIRKFFYFSQMMLQQFQEQHAPIKLQVPHSLLTTYASFFDF